MIPKKVIMLKRLFSGAFSINVNAPTAANIRQAFLRNFKLFLFIRVIIGP